MTAPETILSEATRLLHASRFTEARSLLQDAHQRFPQHPSLALALADSFHAEGHLPEAVTAYRRAQTLNPNAADAWYGAGCAQLAQRAYGDAFLSFTRTAALVPNSAPVHYNLGKTAFELGHVDAAISHFRHAASLDPAFTDMSAASIACIIPGSPAATHADIQTARRQWANSQPSSRTKPLFHKPPGQAGEKLRIGYVSAFFGACNWMKPVFAVINRHNRADFTIKMFCDGAAPSAQSGYADYAYDEIHDITGVPNDRAAQIIADVGIDILVDLNGYSAQQRLPMLMQRPAKTQIGWFNMFATTGLDAFDWLVGDNTVIRPDEEKFYNERIFRVPGSYLAFEVLYPVPDIAPPPSLSANGAITFGCLGSHYKMTDSTLDAWSAILRAAPTARLYVKNGALEDSSTRAEFLTRFTVRGIAEHRLTLSGRSEHFDFLDAYRHVDIALDTFPYNGGTTTTEALWQGVPVLSFYGDRWASRTSASLLNAAGLHDWLMPDAKTYVRQAITLANTPPDLAAMRSNLRTQLRACDPLALCQSLESFYKKCADAD
jgi:predicted O-linked N-acetylglucosamine transferase (SPINDLY family)